MLVSNRLLATAAPRVTLERFRRIDQVRYLWKEKLTSVWNTQMTQAPRLWQESNHSMVWRTV